VGLGENDEKKIKSIAMKLKEKIENQVKIRKYGLTAQFPPFS
jgi:hypothetical protein